MDKCNAAGYFFRYVLYSAKSPGLIEDGIPSNSPLEKGRMTITRAPENQLIVIGQTPKFTDAGIEQK